MTPVPAGITVATHPDIGLAVYSCDPVPEATSATVYTWRRNGAILGRQASHGNWYDQFLYADQTHSVTVSASLIGDHSDESAESTPIALTLPQPVPPKGGELLFLCISFADQAYDAAPPDLSTQLAFLRSATGGRTPLTATVQPFTLSGPRADYVSGVTINKERVYAELIASLNLQDRAGLHRVGIDLPGLNQDNAGLPLWGERFDRNTVWGMFVNSGNLCHELLHTWGLAHCAWTNVPADPDNPQFSGVFSGEVMGEADLTPLFNFTQRWMLGGRLASQMVRTPPYGGTYTLQPVENASGLLEAVVIPCTAAGSCYVVEHRGGLPRVQLRPFRADRQYQVGEFPLWTSGTNVLLNDTYRGIKVTFSGFSASGVTINITTPIPKPVTDGGGGTGGTGGGHGHGHGRTK